MSSVLSFFLPYIVFLGALASPGPDFLIVMRNALGHSARAGIITAAGIAAGLVFHMAYCLAGMALLITGSIMLFNLFKWIGAGYLIYIGVQAVRSQGAAFENTAGATREKSAREAFVNGLITNLFNPKATLFFLALFTQVIDPATPLTAQLSFCIACIATAFIWFSGVSILMSAPPARRAYVRASRGIDRIFGGFFIALGAKLAFTRPII